MPRLRALWRWVMMSLGFRPVTVVKAELMVDDPIAGTYTLNTILRVKWWATQEDEMCARAELITRISRDTGLQLHTASAWGASEP